LIIYILVEYVESVCLYSLCYGLDGLGIESGQGRDITHPSRPTLGPNQPPMQWVPGFPRGGKRPGRGVDHPPSSSIEVKERVELTFPLPGFRGLYRANFNLYWVTYAIYVAKSYLISFMVLKIDVTKGCLQSPGHLTGT
jgi:hypothetical protein